MRTRTWGKLTFRLARLIVHLTSALLTLVNVSQCDACQESEKLQAEERAQQQAGLSADSIIFPGRWPLSAEHGARWEVRAEGTDAWRAVEIPTTNEAALADSQSEMLGARFAGAEFRGDDFEGLAEYRLTLDRKPHEHPLARLRANGGYHLRFDAVATECEVTWLRSDGSTQVLGKHLGGWTPFEIDISHLYESDEEAFVFLIRVDEKAGHNTQGFLPIIQPHFGGIWQQAWLVGRHFFALDDLHTTVVASGSIDQPTFQVETRLAFSIPLPKRYEVVAWVQPTCDCPARASTELPPAVVLTPHDTDSGVSYRGEVPVADLVPWTPENPHRYRVVIGINDRESKISEEDFDAFDRDAPQSAERTLGVNENRSSRLLEALKSSQATQLHGPSYPANVSQLVDAWQGLVGWRSVRTDGRRLLINEVPSSIRGVLNWGYSRRGLGPTLDRAEMKREIEFCRARGFNLMKFCLWLPPRDYLDLCDELGMLVWMEYPTWHPQMDKSTQAELLREYDEFYRYDGRYASIVLHSLTCETGHGADEEVLRSLYDLGKKRIPGAIIEDDSSWITWHRIHDFYDDHPYGNSHRWREMIARLDEHISGRKSMPLMLGEAIAADTWFDAIADSALMSAELSEELFAEVTEGSTESLAELPYWMPGFSRANVGYQRWVESELGPIAAERLVQDSKHYALAMRKFQVEAFRADQPDAGYVVSVIRDFPLAGMGLIDYADRPKWTAEDWNWHGSTQLSLELPDDRRSCWIDQAFQGEVVITCHEIGEVFGAKLLLSLGDTTRELAIAKLKPGQQQRIGFRFDSAALTAGKIELKANLIGQVTGRIGSSVEARPKPSASLARNRWHVWGFAANHQSPAISVTTHPSWDLDLPLNSQQVSWSEWLDKTPDARQQIVVLARQVDEVLIDALAAGQTIVLLANNQTGSFRREEHWFLRGAPIISDRLAEWGWDRELWLELQTMDLAESVSPDWIDLEAIEPWLVLWNNHDIKQVKTHPLLFRLAAGRGSIWVSYLPFDASFPASSAVLTRWIQEAHKSNKREETDQSRDTLARLSDELDQRELSLVDLPWRFKVDTDHQGVEQGWQLAEIDSSDWQPIRIDRHWDAQGYGALDGWAWYRTEVTLPEDWNSDQTYISFTGVDDHYRVYVNGKEIGQGGDIEKRLTAFEERTSHDISEFTRPGAKLSIAIEVYDWYGAGGIFRPVSLTARPIRAEKPWLAD